MLVFQSPYHYLIFVVDIWITSGRSQGTKIVLEMNKGEDLPPIFLQPNYTFKKYLKSKISHCENTNKLRIPIYLFIINVFFYFAAALIIT